MEQVKNVIIWGNHSSTQYPDVNHGTVDLPDSRVPIRHAVKDDNWLNGDFIKVQSAEINFYITHKKKDLPLVFTRCAHYYIFILDFI